MTDGEAGHLDESAVQRIVETCEDRLRRGEPVDREALLAAHPDLRPLLDEVLSGLDLVRRAAPSLELDGRSADLPTPPIERLGDFVLRREIGRGGMGCVYEAEQVSLGRRVAVKVLPFFGQIAPKRLRRFRIEVQAAAQLHHTNIVPVHFVGEERGIHYYVMQLIDGQPLSRILEDLRRWELEKGTASRIAGLTDSSSSTRSREYFQSVARIGIQAARALEHAHSMGIVHRDIKPSNLLLDSRGQLWVTDFGLARIQTEGSLTTSGEVLGTLRYMSPEQALGRADVDERTDIYSLGATLAELATLEDPYRGDDREEILRRVTSEDVRHVSASGRPVSRDLETVLLKCLAKAPAERYASAGDLAHDLERFLEDRAVEARRPGPLRRAWKWVRRNRALSTAAVLAVALAASAAYSAHQRFREARLAEYQNLVRGAVMEAQAGLLCARFGPGAYQRAMHERYLLDLSSSAGESDAAESAIARLGRAADLLPGDPAAPYHAARILYWLEREVESVAALERALAADPQFAPAVALYRCVKVRKQGAASSATVAADPSGDATRDLRLWTDAYRAAAEGRWPAAAQAYWELSRRELARHESYTGAAEEVTLGLGATRFENGDFLGALQVFAVAEHLWPEAATPTLFKAKALYLLEQDDRAEEAFRGLWERSQGDTTLVEEIVIFYYTFFDHVKMLSWLRELPPGYTKEIIEALISSQVAHLGTDSYTPRWYQAALDAADRALRYRPHSAHAHALRGVALLRGQGKIGEGEAAFAQARNLAPLDARVLHYYGEALNGVHEHRRRALEALEEATRLAPMFPFPWSGVGNAAAMLGDFDRSEAAYQRYFELNPMDWCSRVYHGVDLRRAGRYQEAEKQLQEAVRSNPRSAFAWGWLGAHYAATYRGTEALAACERALRLDGHGEHACMLAGETLERLGRPHDAEARYHEVVALEGRRRGEARRRLAELLVRQGRGSEAVEGAVRWLRQDPGETCKDGWLVELLSRHGLAASFLEKTRDLEDVFRASPEAREARQTLIEGSPAAQAVSTWMTPTPGKEWPGDDLERLGRSETLRIRCGGEAVEPVPGELWLADRFSGGGDVRRLWVPDIQGTERDEIYRSHRFQASPDAPFEYRLPLPPGTYRVRLHFAEIWYYVSGQRRFRVAVEGATMADIEPPPGAALVREVETTVSDGLLNLRFLPEREGPLVCGIEIARIR